MNYAAHNKELHHSLKLSEPTIFMKSDSSLLKDGKPFFIPDFSSEIHYETEIVVKIDRLGKNIAERFAHRYSYFNGTIGANQVLYVVSGTLSLITSRQRFQSTA